MSSSTVFDPICRGLTLNDKGKTVIVCPKRSGKGENMKKILLNSIFGKLLAFFLLCSHISVTMMDISQKKEEAKSLGNNDDKR